MRAPAPRPLLAPAMLIASLALIPAACSREDNGSGGSDASTPADPAAWAALKDFTKVEATGPDTVIITRGGFSVTAQGDQKILDRLEIRRDGDTLEIGRKRRYGMNWSDDKGVTIRVSMPAIRAVEATGSGDIDVDRVDGGSFDANLTGSGNLKIASMVVPSLEAEITGSGDMSATGSADKVDLSVTGSGNFAGEGLKAGGGEVSVLGSGNASLSSDGVLDISILGSGDVTVKGKAQCKTSIMGSGEARCRP